MSGVGSGLRRAGGTVARWLEQHLPATLLGVIATILAVSVFWRYVLDSALSWPNELVTVLFLWAIFLAIPGAFRQRAHISVDLFSPVLPARVNHVLRVIAAAISVVILGVFGYYAWRYAGVSTKRLQLTGIHYSWVYGVLALSFALSVLHLLRSPSRASADLVEVPDEKERGS